MRRAKTTERDARDAMRNTEGEKPKTRLHAASTAARIWQSLTRRAGTRAATCGAVMCLHIGLRSRTQPASRVWWSAARGVPPRFPRPSLGPA